MKKVIIILLSAISIHATAQDSASVKVAISLEAGDLEYMYKHIVNREQTEDMYDDIKKKMAAKPEPTGTQLVPVDSASRYAWVFTLDLLRRDALALDKQVYKHVYEKLVAANDPYINARLVKSDENINKAFGDDRKTGRDGYRKERMKRLLQIGQ